MGSVPGRFCRTRSNPRFDLSEAETTKKRSVSTKYGWRVAAAYFVVPLLFSSIVFWRRRDWFFSVTPVYSWRFFYCFFAGCWGLAVRAYERRKGLSPWPDYFVLYPLVLIINACAVFTLLTLFDAKLGRLFWTAALPLCVVFGRYCHPKEWLLTKFIDKAAGKKP